MTMLTAAMASSTVAGSTPASNRADSAFPLFDPMRFGAKGDGIALDSPAINAAIDACTKAGGGVVYLRPGVYRSGTVILKSNVTLYLESGSTILGSLDLNDYTAMPGKGEPPDPILRHLIFAKDAENLALAGPGRVDGQGPHFWQTWASWDRLGHPATPHAGLLLSRPAGYLSEENQWAEIVAHDWKPNERPTPLLRFVNCRWLRIEDVRIENAPGWTLLVYNCDNVRINAISIKNPVYGPNADGFDLVCSQNVFVSNCSIDVGDDAICLKSENLSDGEARLTKNIVITNCVLTTCCNAFKIGTASHGGFENITFSNSVIYSNAVKFSERVMSGIALDMMDGGWIDGFLATSIVMQRARNPIFIRLGNRKDWAGSPNSSKDNLKRGLRAVMIEDIHASESLIPSSITGLKGAEVKDLTLSNIRIENVLPSRPEWLDQAVPEKESAYPEANMFGTIPAFGGTIGMLPVSGLYVRHVRGLRLRDLAFRTAVGEARPTVMFDDVQGARVSGLESSAVASPRPILVLSETNDVWISESAAPAGMDTFVSVEGAKSGNILLSGCDLRCASNPVKLGAEVPAKAVSVIGNVPQG